MDDLIRRKAVRDGMTKYGFRAPDMTVREFVEDELPSVDILSLVRKAQEPEKPIYKQIVNEYEGYTEYINKSFCPKCGAEFIHRVNYCPNCGKAVKWDD